MQRWHGLGMLAVLVLSSCSGGPDLRAQPQGVRILPHGGGAPVLVPWGASQARVKELVGGWCRSAAESWRNWCDPNGVVDFGSAEHRLTASLGLYKERLYVYLVSLDPENDFPMVKAVLTAALGAPDKTSTAVLQNLMGASFPQEELAWSMPDVEVTLVQRGSEGQIDKGKLVVVYRPFAPPPAPNTARAPF